jgi:transposase
VQDFAPYARLDKCPKESAGKRHGSSGAKIGNGHRKWAFSEASVLFLRHTPPAQRYLDQLASTHGKATALSILAHKLGRAVYYMLKRREAFDMKKFLSS